jgi:hypothetical protein
MLNISLEQYLKRLASDLKFNELYTPLGPGHFKLQIPGIEAVELQINDTELRIIAPIGSFPENCDEDKLFSYLLFANYLGQGTGRSVIGLHPSQPSIILSQVIFYPIDYPDFKERIEEFCNFIDYLTPHLNTQISTFLKE